MIRIKTDWKFRIGFRFIWIRLGVRGLKVCFGLIRIKNYFELGSNSLGLNDSDQDGLEISYWVRIHLDKTFGIENLIVYFGLSLDLFGLRQIRSLFCIGSDSFG